MPLWGIGWGRIGLQVGSANFLDRAIQYLAGDSSIIYYKMVYLVMHFLGAILALETVWAIGDIALGLMTFPNIIALFALSGVVAKATKTYFDSYEAN